MHQIIDGPLEDEIQRLQKENKLERTQAYHHIGVLDSCLRAGIDKSLEFFRLPADVIARPLRQSEERYRCPETGKFRIRDGDGSDLLEIGTWPLPSLALNEDREGSNLSAANWIIQNGYLAVLRGDEYHDEWNAIKRACGKTKKKVFLIMLCQLTVLYSLNKAPWNSKAFWDIKRETLADILSKGLRLPIVRDNIEELAKEVGLPPPCTPDDAQQVVQRLCDVPSVLKQGPPIGQAKWWSFARAAEFHKDHMCCERVVLAHHRDIVRGAKPPPEDVVVDEDDQLEGSAKITPKSEWRKMKAKGENSLDVALKMIGKDNCRRQKIFLALTTPAWHNSASRKREHTKPLDCLAWNILRAKRWSSVLLATAKAGFCDLDALKEMGLCYPSPMPSMTKMFWSRISCAMRLSTLRFACCPIGFSLIGILCSGHTQAWYCFSTPMTSPDQKLSVVII